MVGRPPWIPHSLFPIGSTGSVGGTQLSSAGPVVLIDLVPGRIPSSNPSSHPSSWGLGSLPEAIWLHTCNLTILNLIPGLWLSYHRLADPPSPFLLCTLLSRLMGVTGELWCLWVWYFLVPICPKVLLSGMRWKTDLHPPVALLS